MQEGSSLRTKRSFKLVVFYIKYGCLDCFLSARRGHARLAFPALFLLWPANDVGNPDVKSSLHCLNSFNFTINKCLLGVGGEGG